MAQTGIFYRSVGLLSQLLRVVGDLVPCQGVCRQHVLEDLSMDIGVRERSSIRRALTRV